MKIPDMPEGWHLHEIKVVAGYIPGDRGGNWGITGYDAFLRKSPFTNENRVRAEGATWEEALTNAINKVKESQ